jgi:hypothetical protein
LIGTELEELLRRLIREELERLMSGDAPAGDDAELRQRVAERAAAMRRARRTA